MRSAWLGSLLAAVLIPAAGVAQPRALEIQWSSGERNPAVAIVPSNLDDDDDDGVPDALAGGPPAAGDDDVVAVAVLGTLRGPLRVTTAGSLRVLTPTGLVTEWTDATAGRRHVVRLVGIAPSRADQDASVQFAADGLSTRVAVTVVAPTLVRGDLGIVWPHRDAVRISREVANNDTLPRAASWGAVSPDADNIRAEVWDPGATRLGTARLEALATTASLGLGVGAARGAIGELTLERPSDGLPLRSRWIRLVGDEIDLRAPGVQGQTLLVGLRDRVRVRYRRAGVAGDASFEVRVGRPGNENGPLAARRARWHLVVMRDRAGGRPLIGNDEGTAARVAREQVSISNEIYLQCMLTFGDPAGQPVAFADPPANTLVALADDDGLHAAGGELRLRANGRALPPVRVAPGDRPLDTAESLAAVLRAAGYRARVTLNRRTDYGADGSADVVARDARDRAVEFSAVPGLPLTTDRQQSVAIGRVDFSDGIDEFNNLNSSSGTLEERTLLKTVTDEDPTTIDLVVVNRFTHQTRIGEAFVEGDGGAIVNALVLDRTGIAAQREAWTQSHEAGHILLNQPWHPDNMGPDRPWLLMDADASLGAVTGPKRLSDQDCARITNESGVDAVPSLLARYDEARPSPEARRYLRWPSTELYPRVLPSPTVPRPNVARAAPGHPPDRPAADYGLQIE